MRRALSLDSWTITAEDGEEIVVSIDGHTRIVGTPKVGDRVAILLASGGANGSVALAIAPLNPESLPAFPLPKQFHGVVKSIGTTWVVTFGDGTDAEFVVTTRTVIVGNPQAGDRVEIFATVSGATRTAHLILKR